MSLLQTRMTLKTLQPKASVPLPAPTPSPILSPIPVPAPPSPNPPAPVPPPPPPQIIPPAPDWPVWKKNKHLALQTRNVLLYRFPKALRDFSQPKVPLKVDILADFYHAAPDLPRKQIKAAIEDYCGGISYHSQMVAGAPRIDLNGKVVGVVTPEQAAYHVAETARLQLYHARKALQRAERGIF